MERPLSGRLPIGVIPRIDSRFAVWRQFLEASRGVYHGEVRPLKWAIGLGAKLLKYLRTGAMDAIPARVKLRPSRRFKPPTFAPPTK